MIAERLRWLNGEKEPTRIIIGTDKRHLDHVLGEFNTVPMWSLGTFSLSMIAVAFALLLFAMAPIGKLRTAFADYRAGTTPNMRGEFPEEVQPLIDDLNNLIESSGEQMQRARAQAAREVVMNRWNGPGTVCTGKKRMALLGQPGKMFMQIICTKS